jgi:hypothetical protein
LGGAALSGCRGGSERKGFAAIIEFAAGVADAVAVLSNDIQNRPLGDTKNCPLFG